MENPKIAGTGIYAQAIDKYNATPVQIAGRHLWVYLGAWQVLEPARARQIFDMENLVTVTGPGCYWCEQSWSPNIGTYCPGESVE